MTSRPHNAWVPIESDDLPLARQTLKRETAGVTSLIVAQRIGTIRDADLILVMDQGRIVEQGTHEELVRAGGYYATAFHHQYGDYAQQSAQSEGKEA